MALHRSYTTSSSFSRVAESSERSAGGVLGAKRGRDVSDSIAISRWVRAPRFATQSLRGAAKRRSRIGHRASPLRKQGEPTKMHILTK